VLYDADGRPIRRVIDPGVELFTEDERESYTEITRSFSYKISLENYGGPRYESLDFFCSQKVHCRTEEAEDASLAAYAFCRREVLNAVAEVKAGIREKSATKKNSRKVAA
jgi:hypothetical protein